MKAIEEPRKACDNCIYFVTYYQKVGYTYYKVIKCGQCFIKIYTEEERLKLPYDFVCDKWTQKACADTDISEIKDELGDITAKLILIVKALSK